MESIGVVAGAHDMADARFLLKRIPSKEEVKLLKARTTKQESNKFLRDRHSVMLDPGAFNR